MISASHFKAKRLTSLGCALFSSLQLLAGALFAADPIAVPTLDASIDFSGRFRVQFVSNSTDYYKLVRYGQPEERSVVAMAAGTGASISLRDPVLPGQDTLYHVVVTTMARAGDVDDDGLSDALELETYPATNPLNPARSISENDGAIAIPDRETFEYLARRDDVPGAQNIREVKFIMFGADTDSPTIHFFNTNRHLFHFFFSRDVLRYTAGLSVVLIEARNVAELPTTGVSQLIIGNIDGKLHFRVFNDTGRRIDDVSEDGLPGTKQSLLPALKSELAPYWETGIDLCRGGDGDHPRRQCYR